MRAACIEAFGLPAQLHITDRPLPQPAVGQVLVRIKAAGVGPWDVALLGGRLAGLPLPLTPGLEVAGVVERAGEGADCQPGDAVYGSLQASESVLVMAAAGCGGSAVVQMGGGGFAEFAAARSDHLARKPAHLSFAEAAALVVGAGTAYEGLIDRAGLRAGQSVLITAAAGGVGTAAVQIAAFIGARVLGVANARNHAYLRRLGAHAVFDYQAADWVEQVRAAVPGGVEVLFDGAGGATRDTAVGAVRDGGRGVFIVGPPARLERDITADSFYADVNRERLQAISRLVEHGQLRAELEAVLPLDQARVALERVAGGHTRGKIVLVVG